MQKDNKTIKTALISVYNKDGLKDIVHLLHKHNVQIISTGGTSRFIRDMDIPVTDVSDVTGSPEVFGGRVKTLHPKIHGGILNRRDNAGDREEKMKFGIKDIDLVISNLYPFEETVAKGAEEEAIIEEIDIGGVALIRAAAKNFNDVVIVSSMSQYGRLKEILERGATSTLEERRLLAGAAFETTSLYDSAIRGYLQGTPLRYGENPHQQAAFIGNLSDSFEQLHGKELSFNNLIDTEAAITTVYDFVHPAFAIIKHMNACGLAVAEEGHLIEAYEAAYKADPLSAFGGILAANRTVGVDIAKLIKEQELFVEVIIAPDFTPEALEVLTEKKDRRILKWNNPKFSKQELRSCFTGLLVQDRDSKVESSNDLTTVTERQPTLQETKDMLMAMIAVKHLKSNAIAFVKNGKMLSMGCGQTSRIDALKQAVDKAKKFGIDLTGSVVASEAFFPFPDCVEAAAAAGATAVVQPGGSKNDQASIDMANKHGMTMTTTGFRHFKH